MKNPLHSPATSDVSSNAVPLLNDDPQYQAGLSARASRTAMRIAVAEAKGKDAQAEARANADRCLREKCEKAMRKREEAAEKRRQHEALEQKARQAKADKQAAKEAESAVKKQRKADEERERAQRKAEQKAKKAREKQRNHYMGGMAWGYDPKAGVSTSLPIDNQSSPHQPRSGESESRRTSGTAGSAESGPRYYDRVTGKYYRQSEFDSVWGIEIGGPDRSTPPGPHRDRFARAMAEVDKTSRMDRGGLSRDPGPSQEALSDVNGEGLARS